MFYKDIINVVKDTLSRFKGVNYVKYQGDDLNNAQHNYKTIQCYIDDVVYEQHNLTTNINKMELQVYILGFPENDTPDDILDVQDKCYNVAINVLAYLDIKPQFQGILSIYDYDILTLSHYSGQNNAGVKVSIVLNVPSAVNICELEDNFGEPYAPDEDDIITITEDEVGDITLKPINLPKTNRC